MKRIDVSELEGGDDHEFLVRLYTHLLDRWPDRDGYSHYLARIEGKPEARHAAIRAVATSEEARKLGIEVIFPDEPPAPAAPPPPAPPLALAPEAAAAPPAVPSARPGPAAQPLPGVFGALSTINAELAALRAQVQRLENELAALRAAQR